VRYDGLAPLDEVGAMITRIEIDGFKSLRQVALDLEPLTVVVGPNGSGKSNFVEALRLLSRLAQPDPRLDRALGAGRGTIAEQFTRLSKDARADAIRLAVELTVRPAGQPTGDPRHCRYEIEILEASRGDEIVLVVGAESLQVQDLPPLRRSRREPFAFRVRDDSLNARVRDALRPIFPFLSLPRSFFDEDHAPFVEAVATSLLGLRVLRGEPARLGASSDPASTPGLDEQGGNLPTSLNGLSAVPRLRVAAQISRLVPALRRVEVETGSDGLLFLRFQLGDATFPARVISDGTLRLLAMLVHVHSDSEGVAIIEEPENGVHPASLRALLEILCDETTPGGSRAIRPQVILVSHSPAVVAALQDRPQALVFADVAVTGGGTRFTRLLHVRRDDQAPDAGRSSVSPRAILRLLETAAASEHA
jgi:predicted ATPase